MQVVGTQVQVDSMLDVEEVEVAVKLKKSAIYAAVKKGAFPAPYRVGARRVAWKSSEVQAFLNALVRVELRDGVGA